LQHWGEQHERKKIHLGMSIRGVEYHPAARHHPDVRPLGLFDQAVRSTDHGIAHAAFERKGTRCAIPRKVTMAEN
jgi:hypothetical protein